MSSARIKVTSDSSASESVHKKPRACIEENPSHMALVWPAVVLCFCLIIACTADSSSIYWGAYIYGFPNWPPSDQPIRDFQSHAGGKGLSIVHWGMPWYHDGSFQGFPTGYMDVIHNYGAIPMIDWSPWDYCCGQTQANWTLAKVYSGLYDSYIHSFAQQVKAWGHPLWLRHNHEMNGWWQFPWAEQINGNQPGDFVRAWRHVHEIFTAEAVENVAWVWCPNIISPQTTPLESLYPGDAYVDWLCLDGYNFGPLRDEPWLSFTQVFRGGDWNGNLDSYAAITALAPQKPLMLGEFGCAENLDGGAAKAQWITNALSSEILSMPAIKAIAWFNWDIEALPGQTQPSGASWPIETSLAAQTAWAASIQADSYIANVFSHTDPSLRDVQVEPQQSQTQADTKPSPPPPPPSQDDTETDAPSPPSPDDTETDASTPPPPSQDDTTTDTPLQEDSNASSASGDVASDDSSDPSVGSSGEDTAPEMEDDGTVVDVQDSEDDQRAEAGTTTSGGPHPWVVAVIVVAAAVVAVALVALVLFLIIRMRQRHGSAYASFAEH